MSGLSRRDFVKLVGGAAAAASLPASGGCERGGEEAAVPSAALREARRAPASGAARFEDRWRAKWTWDTTAKSSHFNNCAYQTHCTFEIYSRDGAVVREEQAAAYPALHDGVPDPNPRGCQKGCAYGALEEGGSRITRPLRRKGERGSGSWEAVSWDEALGEIADRLVSAIAESGPDSVVMDVGTNGIGTTAHAASQRLAEALDCVLLDPNPEIGDQQQGAAVTYGGVGSARSTESFFDSDLILIWSGNPAYTQIPNFHFLTEARYHGATLVTIAPDYNASAIHTDLFVPIRPGTDAALALALAKLILDEGPRDPALLREQTDLPILVRLDTKKFLRESDLVAGGSDETLYRWDLARGALEIAPVESLALGASDPALEGTFEVQTLAGRIEVQPVYERLKAEVAQWTPEAASRVCGTPPGVIRRLARMLTTARAASNVETLCLGKIYHGDAIMRAQILVFVLAGHLGRRGAGYAAISNLVADGHGPILGDTRGLLTPGAKFKRRWAAVILRDHLLRRPPPREVIRALSESFVETKGMSSATLFWQLHGGVIDVSAGPWDPTLPRGVREYVSEALEKKWQLVEPAPEKRPRALLVMAGNPLRRVRGAHRLREVLWPKLDLVVVTDIRMSSTALFADYVLPVAASYEKANASSFVNQFLLVHAAKAVTEPIGDAKDEWEIASLLTAKVQERAKARGISEFTGRRGDVQRLDTAYDRLSRDGELGPKDAEKFARGLVENATNLDTTSFEAATSRGWARVTSLGRGPINASSATDWADGEPITPYLWHVRDKKPWPTLTGRVQFYIDHDWYLELGETLPTFKEPPRAGGEYPLQMTGGHTRWSIHSLQRADTMMLRLQRGEPALYVAIEDARARGLTDWDRVEVSNDVGRFRVRVKLSPALRPGQVVMYHAWEDYQFEGGIGHRNVLATPLNPLGLVGDYPYLGPTFGIRHPGMNDRDTRVEI
ncbi:MAG: molybdopterin-dependent oxidoreductase, partial [Deltaproteobacteria bacterium]|nr:molybdopterin-dependent oxidoreductase [Deltaproteobacteria bacterium]